MGHFIFRLFQIRLASTLVSRDFGYLTLTGNVCLCVRKGSSRQTGKSAGQYDQQQAANMQQRMLNGASCTTSPLPLLLVTTTFLARWLTY